MSETSDAVQQGETPDESQSETDPTETGRGDPIPTEHPDAPFVATDPDIWHPVRCGRVRDADEVETVEQVGERGMCPWCRLFIDQPPAEESEPPQQEWPPEAVTDEAAASPELTDQYEDILRAATPGLRLTINDTHRNTSGTDELQVLRNQDGELAVDLKTTGDATVQYRIHRDFRGDLVLSRLSDDGLRLQTRVVTIEIVGC